MKFIYLIFYACQRLWFLDVEANLARCVLCLLSAEHSSNMRSLAWNLSDLTVASSQYDMLFCPGTKHMSQNFCWSQKCVTCRSWWFPVWVILACCVRARYLGPVGWRHTYEMVTEHFANPNFRVVVAKCWFLGFVM